MPGQVKRVHFAPDVVDGSHRPPAAFQKKHSQASSTSQFLCSIVSSISSSFTRSSSPPSLPDVSPFSSCIKGAPKKIAPLPPKSPLSATPDLPFSRWFTHYSTAPSASWQARGWAIFNSAEGLLRTIKEVVCWCFYKMTCQSDKALVSADKTKQLWDGVCFSVEAIFRPYTVIEKFQKRLDAALQEAFLKPDTPIRA